MVNCVKSLSQVNEHGTHDWALFAFMRLSPARCATAVSVESILLNPGCLSREGEGNFRRLLPQGTTY